MEQLASNSANACLFFGTHSSLPAERKREKGKRSIKPVEIDAHHPDA
jgi:hypothetical protein